MKENIYEQKSIKQLIFIFSVPAILSLIVEVLTSVVDTAFAGHLGIKSANALTAMGLISPILSIFTAIQTLFAISTAIIIAKYLNNRKILNKYFLCGFSMTMLISILTSLVSYIFLNPILSILGVKGQVLHLANQYLKIQLVSNIFSAIGYTLTSCIRAFGYPKIEAIIIILAVVVNIIFNSVFTFGFSMGIVGLSIGTLISEVFGSVFSMIWLYRKKLLFGGYAFRKREFINMAFDLFKIGAVQTVIQMLSSFTGFLINNRLLSLGGSTYIAAWNVSQKLYIFILMPIVGITQGVQTIISYFNGHKEDEKKSKTIKSTIIYCMIYGIIATVGTFLMGDKMLYIFGVTSEIHRVAIKIIRVIFITFPFVGILYTIMTLLQVTNREVQAILLGLIRQVFSVIPFIIIFPIVFSKIDIGITPIFSIFLVIPLADILSTIVAVILFKKTSKDLRLKE